MKPGKDSHPNGPVLWCLVCRATAGTSPEDLLQYARFGWPRCCEKAMCYYVRPATPPELITPVVSPRENP